MSYDVKQINYRDVLPFLLEIHYAKKVPSVIQYSFGLFANIKGLGYDLFEKKDLVGVITYGIPASNSLCKGVAGEQNADKVLELSRLCLKFNKKNEASILVGRSLKLLPTPKIIVSYADTAHNHIGYVYQATNFLFTGTTKPRTDMAGKDGKHSRHHLGDRTKRVFRSAKHRYLFVIGNKRDKKKLLKQIKYPIQNYPKQMESI